MWDFLRKILEVSNQYANLILVLVTIVYAWITYETVKVMRRQVTADIRVSKAYVRVSAVGKKDSLKLLALKDLVKRPFGSLKEVVFVFRLSADFINASSGGGYIDQPKFLIKFSSSNFELEVRPTSERLGSGRRTIAVPGNGFEKIDLEYFVSYNEKFIAELKKHPESIEYYLRYKDNLNKKHSIIINEVSGLK